MANVDPVVDAVEEDWQKENIPDQEFLYYRIHRNDLKNGQPVPGAFRNAPKGVVGAGMSTNWQRYSTPEQARVGAGQPPGSYAVVKLVVQEVRQLPDQRVEHTPDRARANRSHSDVFGEKTVEVRAKLLNIYEMMLMPEPPNSS